MVDNLMRLACMVQPKESTSAFSPTSVCGILSLQCTCTVLSKSSAILLWGAGSCVAGGRRWPLVKGL
eukprot:6448911-Amphidinium_carterae.1